MVRVEYGPQLRKGEIDYLRTVGIRLAMALRMRPDALIRKFFAAGVSVLNCSAIPQWTLTATLDFYTGDCRRKRITHGRITHG
jgi:hypothetical protein